MVNVDWFSINHYSSTVNHIIKMRKFVDSAIEIMASVWLVIVAVQFLDSYFGTQSLDLTYTYWAMLAILAVVSGVRAVRYLRERRRAELEQEISGP